MRHLDLFSGIGGFALGFRNAGGIETVGFCEIEPYCQAILRKNFPGKRIFNDITKIEEADLSELGNIDLITAGFPCQDISIAGKNRGIQGERSSLFYEAIRIVGVARPKILLLENTPNLLIGGGGIGCQLFSGAWPKSGMMLCGSVYQLNSSGHHTRGKGFGSLPGMLTTLTVSDSKGGMKKNWSMGRIKLVDQINLLQRLNGRILLHGRFSWRKLNKQFRESYPSENAQPAGPLNPTWCEWFMGYPEGWTELNPSEMQSYLKSRRCSEE